MSASKCEKVCYPNQASARTALHKLMQLGYPVCRVYRCGKHRRGVWHVTSKLHRRR